LGIGSVLSKLRIFQVFLVVSVILFAIGIIQPISSERSFYFEKVLDINKKSFQDSLTNLNNLPKIFPENIKSVELSSNENEIIKAKMILGVGGFSIRH